MVADGITLRDRSDDYQVCRLCYISSHEAHPSISNIGTDAKALWRHWDDSATAEFIQQQQLLHVSILSFLNFAGRLVSGKFNINTAVKPTPSPYEY